MYWSNVLVIVVTIVPSIALSAFTLTLKYNRSYKECTLSSSPTHPPIHHTHTHNFRVHKDADGIKCKKKTKKKTSTLYINRYQSQV
ncbi:hypothetical protein OAV88_03675 [bacterium]|nr:hypothetical protein [bacterium]